MSHPKLCRAPRLVAISSGVLAPNACSSPTFRGWLGRLEQAGVSLQLREKHLSARDLLALSATVRSNFSGSLFINSRADVAVAAGADGVHLTSTAPVTQVVAAFGHELIIGASTHSQAEAQLAKDAGCDYAFLSPVFSTPSKAGVGRVLGLEDLGVTASENSLPILALGGIDASNAHLVWPSGVHGIAAIRGFAESPETLAATLPA